MTPSVDAQLRYIIQWFQEWSELQRSDFLPILADKYANKVYVNGMVGGLSSIDCGDRPMSLFQCRVKLFKEWFGQWTPDHKESLLKRIKEIDSNFAEKLDAELQNGDVAQLNHEQQNGELLLED